MLTMGPDRTRQNPPSGALFGWSLPTERSNRRIQYRLGRNPPPMGVLAKVDDVLARRALVPRAYVVDD